ncbi:hypothetical protein WICPIJ_007663 [Wickerhamomyces pijperi]|uniref:Uncharacterized protein n=1 Tax=Wickerhamomyces pijperi TaxID=599730 RepID=A0A9P8TJR7_WICPI|nr:hypothetical protein WICPIJ_007663 [Wickerhamomyces pijperi]
MMKSCSTMKAVFLAWRMNLLITFEQIIQGGLTSTVFTHHDQDFGIGEVTSFNVQLEVTLGSGEGWVCVMSGGVHLDRILGIGQSELQGFGSEPQVFGNNVTIQEHVDTFSDGGWQGDNTVHGWGTVKNTNEIRQVIQHGQIVLHDDDV